METRDTATLGAAPVRWSTGLTAMHWRVLTGGFLGWVFDGYEAIALIMVLGPMLHALLAPAQLASFPVYAGTAIGITLLGWGLGGLVGGVLADYIGRKRMMLWSVFLYAVFSGLTAFADSFVMLCALRFLTGLALGSEWSTGISLLAETWPQHARAKGAGFLQSGFGWGTLLASVAWYVLSITHPLGAQSWRLMFVLGALPALFVLYLRRGVEESEKWREAVRARRWGPTEQATGPAATGAQRPFSLMQLFRDPAARRRTVITTVLSIVTTTGWWAISSWLPIFTIGLAKAQGLAGAPVWGARVSISYTVGAIIAYMIAGFIADAIGRRLFMFLTFVGCLVTTVITYKYTHTVGAMMVIAPINGFFTLGCAYVWMAIYPVELFTSTVRSTAISVVFNAARLIAWVFPIIAGTLIRSFGGISQAALIIGLVYLLGLVLPWMLPETVKTGLPD